MFANLEPFTHARLPDKRVPINRSTRYQLLQVIQGNGTFLPAVTTVMPVTHCFNREIIVVFRIHKYGIGHNQDVDGSSSWPGISVKQM